MGERTKEWLCGAAVVAVIALPAACWWLCSWAPKKPAGEKTATTAATVTATSAPMPDATSPGPKAFRQSEEPAYSPLADEFHAARFDAAHDLEVLRALVGQLTTTLRLAERPPLGDNADIAAALSGRNRRRVVFVPPTHAALREGVLVDRLGTPYHFHARSADAIDVRSAGPDRVLFTADDLVSSGLDALNR